MHDYQMMVLAHEVMLEWLNGTYWTDPDAEFLDLPCSQKIVLIEPLEMLFENKSTGERFQIDIGVREVAVDD